MIINTKILSMEIVCIIIFFLTLNNKIIVVNYKGEIIYNNYTFDKIEVMRDGLAVVIKDNKYGIINCCSEEVYLRCEYDYCKIISSLIFAIKKDDFFYLVDINKILEYPDQGKYLNVSVLSDNCIAVQDYETKKWGYLDIYGDVIIDFMYDKCGDFKNNIAYVKKGEESFIINNDGKILIELNEEEK